MRRLVLVVASAALIAAACGDDADDESQPTAEPAPAVEEAPAASDEPEEAVEEAPAASDEPEEAVEEAPAPGEEDVDDAAATEEPADDEPADAATEEETSPMSVDLSGVCPDPLVLQTDWFPSPEHGYAYRLIGDAGELDTENGVYRGPLLATGIDLEIRAGGPYLGFAPTTATMQLDEGIHFGYVNTDEQIAAWDVVPTVAVAAPFDTNPQILMWSPEEYSFSSFEDIGQSDAAVVYFAGGVFIDYMVDAGILRADQVDPSYDGSPARFVAEGGAVVQQGFATSEPWLYENALEEWGKPVDFLLIHDSGFEIYAQPLVVRAAVLEDLRPCLELVVPIFQQSVIDHYADPGPTDAVILQIVEDLASFWVLYPGQMEYSSATALELGNVGNGPDGIVGNMDDARMEGIVQLLKDVLEGVPQDIEASDIYTNEFIDPSIGF
ncbi:MAG: ABC transporter substrate-binding protein [Acidimicrobiia bacterium]|nr:ABC transporter substrate-binding protein [Acidimicrobiia bacterium]